MGLIKAIKGAAGGVMADQWKEYFYCEAMPVEIIMQKGIKKESGRSANKKGSDNIISSGSVIAVADGQAMAIIEQGEIVEFTAEAGEFVFDSSTEPTIFQGNLDDAIKTTFNQMVKRFTFGGEPPKDQRVYYFNTRELTGNKYGTPNSVPFRVVDERAGIDIDIGMRCFGEYSYRLIDPMLFYKNVAGNISEDFRREEIDSQLKTELLTALQPAFARLSSQGIRYSSIVGHTMELADALNQILSEKWRNLRGIEIVSFGVSSIKADEEDEKMLKELQRNVAFMDPRRAAAHMVGAQAQAMQDAAKNEGGAMTGFLGMNMAQNQGGLNANNLFQMSQQNQPQQPQAPQQPSPQAPEAQGWNCPSCNTLNQGRFCTECGTKKPGGFKCDKCGWTPKDSNIPKFCPECGDVFDEKDKI